MITKLPVADPPLTEVELAACEQAGIAYGREAVRLSDEWARTVVAMARRDGNAMAAAVAGAVRGMMAEDPSVPIVAMAEAVLSQLFPPGATPEVEAEMKELVMKRLRRPSAEAEKPPQGQPS